MMFRVRLECNNAAFAYDDDEVTSESAAHEVARLLRVIAESLENGRDASKWQNIHDVNGNNVGQYKLADDEAFA